MLAHMPKHMCPPSLSPDTKHLKADPSLFHKREFCFTMDGDIFVRYQSFKASPCVPLPVQNRRESGGGGQSWSSDREPERKRLWGKQLVVASRGRN